MMRVLPALCAVALVAVPGLSGASPEPAPVRVLVRHSAPPAPAVLLGLRFGLDEVSQTMRLLGRRIVWVEGEDGAAVDATVTTGGADVSVSAAGAGTAEIDTPCTFSVRPGPDRRAAALSTWRTGAGAHAAEEARVAEWHPALVKFGAAQLNERFARATGTGMTAEAWAGWIAMKALGEAALRAEAAGSLCGALTRQALDGHKGQPLRFDPVTRELNQPLYVVTDRAVLAEIDTTNPSVRLR
jgi:hypothetical protein